VALAHELIELEVIFLVRSESGNISRFVIFCVACALFRA
jgi:hypothetical protein